MEGRGGEGKGDVRVMTSVSVGSISRTQALGLVRVDGGWAEQRARMTRGGGGMENAERERARDARGESARGGRDEREGESETRRRDDADERRVEMSAGRRGAEMSEEDEEETRGGQRESAEGERETRPGARAREGRRAGRR